MPLLTFPVYSLVHVCRLVSTCLAHSKYLINASIHSNSADHKLQHLESTTMSSLKYRSGHVSTWLEFSSGFPPHLGKNLLPVTHPPAAAHLPNVLSHHSPLPAFPSSALVSPTPKALSHLRAFALLLPDLCSPLDPHPKRPTLTTQLEEVPLSHPNPRHK